MPVAFDEKDLARFPFLLEAQAKIAGSQLNQLESFLASDVGARIIRRATDRIEAALTIPPQGQNDHFRLSQAETSNPLESLYTYGMARIIASCLGDRSAIERLISYESRRSSFFLMSDESDETAEADAAKSEAVAAQLGLSLSEGTVAVPAYVEMVAGLREPLWRLVNREVHRGLVRVYPTELEVLLRERIRVVIRARGLPPVPPEVCVLLASSIEHLTAVLQAQMLRDLGPVDESRYPPCMNALLAALLSGKNLTHMGRFALTAFLHTIGLSTTQIVEVYQRSPDFDIEKTLYQVEHISGRSGTEYTPPSCATMLTNGLCVGQDGLCERIGSPLGYYRKKKKRTLPGERPDLTPSSD
ncbi:Eukaryotic and archaeal DNA primase, large subunit [anaerobic digester metagenome]